MKRAIQIACAVANLATCDGVAATVVELAGPSGNARLLDFSVDATHVYVAFGGYGHRDMAQTQRNDGADAVLDVFSRSEGAKTASVEITDLWAGSQLGSGASILTVPYRSGVAVAVKDDASRKTSLVLVNQAGRVGLGRVHDFDVTALSRYGDFVLASSPRELGLFDERLDLKHAWSSPHTLIVSGAKASEIFVVDGIVDFRTWTFAGMIRRLALVGDQLVERQAVGVPVDLGLLLPPKLLIWPDGVLLIGQAQDGWQECELTFAGAEVVCRPAAWGEDLTSAVDMRRWARLSVVRSGANGYAVTVPNGCAVWTRHFGRTQLVAPQEYVLPSGSSGLGLVDDLLVKESDGHVFMLISSSLNGRWWGEGDHRIAFHEPALSESPAAPPHPVVEGCWNDGIFGMTVAVDGSLRATTADDVRACVAKGADPNAVFNCGEWTRPLNQAARLDNASAVHALLAAGAEVNARDEAGETALHQAARYADSDATVKALLDGGADTTLRNRSGHTAWDYAKENDALTGSGILPLLRGD